MVVGLERTVTRGRKSIPTSAASPRNSQVRWHRRGAQRPRENPLNSDLNIVAPVNGTNMARNAAEIAFVIAHATNAPVTVLFVAQRAPTGKKRRRGIRARRHEQAILKDLTGLAEAYGVQCRTAVLADIAADEAMLKETESGKHNLIIMGASPPSRRKSLLRRNHRRGAGEVEGLADDRIDRHGRLGLRLGAHGTAEFVVFRETFGASRPASSRAVAAPVGQLLQR
jgi:nucleotide-binding universal stress UspA family protein